MWRERQIALSARLVKVVSRFRLGQAVLSLGQRVWPFRVIYAGVMGYRRPFATLRQAAAAVASYSGEGHESSGNVDHHLELSAKARPSDYAALFHLQPLISGLRRIFDLGGNAGNLYYCYSHHLAWLPELVWEVMDLPANIARGRAIAAERGAMGLRFTETWAQASGVDLLIVSGSLHYMDRPLAEMIAELAVRPRWVLINRTPLTDGKAVATIQEMSGFRLACMLYNRLDFVRELEAIGYEVVDQWEAAEISMEIPGYPEHTVWAYTGMFLRVKER